MDISLARRPMPGGLSKFSTAMLAGAFIACFAPCVDAQVRTTSGNAAAGRAFALQACTGCHVVAADQPFPPDLTGLSDFRSVANRPNTSAVSLRKFLTTLPTIPPPGKMADPDLTAAEREDVIAYIISLRDHP
jgi:mono/diheme cytochrome c family protein